MNELPIDITTAAAELCLGRHALHYHLKLGRIPYRRIGNMLVVLPQDWRRFKARYEAGEFRRWPVRPQAPLQPRWRRKREAV